MSKYRVSNAIKVGWWAFKHPMIWKEDNFRVICELFSLIMKVSTEGRHMMTKIGTMYPDGEKEDIVSLWVGAGLTADPTDRISELLQENSRLKMDISRLVNEKQP